MSPDLTSSMCRYMHDYNTDYRKYQAQWDAHYANLRATIKKQLSHAKDFALVGCGSLVEELNPDILSKIDSLTLVDVVDDFLAEAKKKLPGKKINTLNFDITLGLAQEFSSSLWKAVRSRDPLSSLSSLTLTSRSMKDKPSYDFIVQSMVLDFFAYPTYIDVIKFIEKEGLEPALIPKVQEAMLRFNHSAAQTAMSVMHSLCRSNGTLIVFTNVARIPERSLSSYSTQTIYFPRPVKWYVENAGFRVLEQKTTEWVDVPEGPATHKHIVQHIVSKKV